MDSTDFCNKALTCFRFCGSCFFLKTPDTHFLSLPEGFLISLNQDYKIILYLGPSGILITDSLVN